METEVKCTARYKTCGIPRKVNALNEIVKILLSKGYELREATTRSKYIEVEAAREGFRVYIELTRCKSGEYRLVLEVEGGDYSAVATEASILHARLTDKLFEEIVNCPKKCTSLDELLEDEDD